jgi:hypothetical protein
MKTVGDFDLDTQQVTACLYFTLAGGFFYEILKNKKKKLFCAFVDF